MSDDNIEPQGYGARGDGSHADDIEEEAQPLNIEQLEVDDGQDVAPGRKPPRNRILLRFKIWINGPKNPRTQTIRPWLPRIQEYPIEWLAHACPSKRAKILLLASTCLCWFAFFAFALIFNNRIANVSGSEEATQYLDCVDTFWYAQNGCGLDGNNCQPFNGSSFAFRCPANCGGVQLLNPRIIGAQEVVYRPLVVGGPIYRGDSWICGAAIHAGIVNDFSGGCGVVSRIGSHDSFLNTTQNYISSIAFDSNFPLSFSFSSDSKVTCKAKDQRWRLLGVSSFFTVALSLFTTSPALHFFTLSAVIFAHVSLVSDPSGISYRSVSILADLFSNFVGRFLPAAFCGVVIYWICVKRSLMNLTAQFEKTFLWVGGCWFGALSNYTFEWIPISRLTSHDLEQQPGAKLALSVIIIIIVLIVAQQIYYFRLEGRLPRYLTIYGVFIAAILVSLALPSLNLRIHHYIVALLLLPGTSMQTRPSLLYQGLLVGLFINGIARWGFDPVLQTTSALRGDGAFDSLIPSVSNPVIVLGTPLSNATFHWERPPVTTHYDGISFLVNDVERYRSYFGSGQNESFVWTRKSSEMPEYFRFGYLKEGVGLDYTKAGIWNANGTWLGIDAKN